VMMSDGDESAAGPRERDMRDIPRRR
jgi:hypothetical protein